MSDTNAWNGGQRADDAFAAEMVEATIVRSLRADAHTTPSTELVRALASAYTLPQSADAVLARSRATLARRAEALDTGRLETGGPRIISIDARPTSARFSAQPPHPPRRRLSPFATAVRTAAAVLVVGLLGAGFYALLRGMPGQGTHPTPTATRSPISATATPTAILPQPPAPAGVYVTTQHTLLLLNASTGAIQQRYPLAASDQVIGMGAPAVANGMVYFTTVTNSAPRQGAIVAVSATSGAQLWRTPTADEVVQLTQTGGILYGETVSNTVTGSDTLYALRASDGKVLWTYNMSTLRGVPVVAGGVVYVANQPQNTTRQHLHALRGSDGSQLWDSPLGQDCAMGQAVAVDQGRVFATCVSFINGGSDSVYALSASDGSVVWHITTNGQPNVVEAGAGLVYVSLGGKNVAGMIEALDETSGAVRWQAAASGDGWFAFDGTTVYAFVASGSAFTAPVSSNLVAFSASQGTPRWTYSMANQRVEPVTPVIAGGVVYVGLSGQIVAVSAASGTALWRSPDLGSEPAGLSGMFVATAG